MVSKWWQNFHTMTLNNTNQVFDMFVECSAFLLEKKKKAQNIAYVTKKKKKHDVRCLIGFSQKENLVLFCSWYCLNS